MWFQYVKKLGNFIVTMAFWGTGLRLFGLHLDSSLTMGAWDETNLQNGGLTNVAICHDLGVSKSWGYPQIIHFSRLFHYKSSSYWDIPISGTHHLSFESGSIDQVKSSDHRKKRTLEIILVIWSDFKMPRSKEVQGEFVVVSSRLAVIGLKVNRLNKVVP